MTTWRGGSCPFAATNALLVSTYRGVATLRAEKDVYKVNEDAALEFRFLNLGGPASPLQSFLRAWNDSTRVPGCVR